jgi:DNA polymerase theta
MIGRAGRKGVDTEGESILLCRESERTKVQQLVSSDLEPVKSCLIQAGNAGVETLCSSMKRAILEVIVSGVASTPEQVEKYASCTLLSVSMMQIDSSSPFTDNSIQVVLIAGKSFTGNCR